MTIGARYLASAAGAVKFSRNAIARSFSRDNSCFVFRKLIREITVDAWCQPVGVIAEAMPQFDLLAGGSFREVGIGADVVNGCCDLVCVGDEALPEGDILPWVPSEMLASGADVKHEVLVAGRWLRGTVRSGLTAGCEQDARR